MVTKESLQALMPSFTEAQAVEGVRLYEAALPLTVALQAHPNAAARTHLLQNLSSVVLDAIRQLPADMKAGG